jgi:4-hydroxybenzoate polyprenyltransferase
VKALARACHPAPTLVVTAVAVLLGVGASLSVAELLVVGTTVLVGQLSIGWSNDWLDAPVDTASGRPDKPAARGDIDVGTLRTLAVAALVAVVPLSLIAGWRAGCAHLLLVASGWVYNLGIKGTVWSPVPYAVGFAALPVYVALFADSGVAWWLPVAGALLGVAAHFANVAPDVETDLRSGVRGLPQRAGAQASLVISLVLLALSGLMTVVPLSSSSALWWLVIIAPLAAGVWLLSRGAIRAVFVVVMVAALLDVLALAVAV